MKNTKNPFEIFTQWFAEAKQKEKYDPTMVSLATATPNGKPSIRIVLLKGFNEKGFVFYTNMGSHKAQEMQQNPFVALCFYWPEIDKQVRIEGHVEKVTNEEADNYFLTRTRESRIGAWASKQSQFLKEEKELDERFKKYEQQFANEEVNRPEFWSGFRVLPDYFEFWERGKHRLHKRTCYQKNMDQWKIAQLYP